MPEDGEDLIVTVVAELTFWRLGDFHRELARLRRQGHAIECQEGPGYLSRRVTVTARASIVTRLLGNG